MYTAYILENARGERYVGSTARLLERLREHNEGKSRATERAYSARCGLRIEDVRLCGMFFAFFLLAAQTLIAQSPSLQFDAVSIKPSNGGSGAFVKLPAISGSEWSAENATPKTLIAYAFDSASGAASAFDPRIVGGPKWIESSSYTVVAKIPSDSPVESVRLMVRNMLTDRFQLKMHRETRELLAYTLTVAKGGSKLAPNAECAQPDAPRLSTDGLLCGTIANQRAASGPNVIVARGVTAPQIADWAFGNENGDKEKPVADRTGLSGLYDFKMTWTPISNRGPNATDKQAVSDENIALVEGAVKDQLGLVLNLTNPSRQPVQVWVIDQIAPPTPN